MAERDEDEQERLNRQLIELLNELRVALPGVQVLFAFLLAVPFQNRFADTSQFERDVYLVTLLASAAATGFLIAPTAYHRILFMRGDRPRIIREGTRFLLAGLVCLAVATTGAVFLAAHFIFGTATAIASGAAVGGALTWLWFGLGLVRRAREGMVTLEVPQPAETPTPVVPEPPVVPDPEPPVPPGGPGSPDAPSVPPPDDPLPPEPDPTPDDG